MSFQKLSPDTTDALGVPRWVYWKIILIERNLRFNLKARHAKVIYWKCLGKDHIWISSREHRSLGNSKNIMSQAMSYLEDTDQIGPAALSHEFLKTAVFFVLDHMIEHDPENIDLRWPPPAVSWKKVFTEDQRNIARFKLCFEAGPTDMSHLDSLIESE
jgi:hypothetical protein